MFSLLRSAIPQRPSPTFCGWRSVTLLVLWTVVVLLIGCQAPLSSSTVAGVTNSAGQPATMNMVTEATSAEGAIAAVVADDAAATGEPMPPVRLAIPSIDFATSVEPMAWRVTEVDGQRQAVWEVPEAGAGWHINSANVGAAGNMVISGHHRQGTAVFAPLARGEVAVDDQIYVTDSAGRIYLYQVSEIAEPIPVIGATTAEAARLAAYQAPSSTAKLTLLTGWPDFSDTHYLIIVADLVGELE